MHMFRLQQSWYCKHKAEEGNAAAVDGFMCGREVIFCLESSGSLQWGLASAPTAAAASQKPLDLMWVSHVKSQDVTLTGGASAHCKLLIFTYRKHK